MRVATGMAGGGAEQCVAVLRGELERGLGGQAPELVLTFASKEQPLGRVMAGISEAFPGAVVLGASTAGEFTEVAERKGSTAAFALAGDLRVRAGFARGLKQNPERAVKAALAEIPSALDGYPYRTAILLLDPLTGCGEEATLLAATILGPDVPLAGGAAGDYLEMKATYVGLNQHADSDALSIAVLFTKVPLGLGVSHGHEPLSPPLRVTRAEGATVYEIDGRPAWQVWEEHTRESAGRRGVDASQLSEAEIGGFLLRYEAGLAAGSAYKIRAPLSRGADGSLAFACGIPEGAEIRITESEPERQVASAREAARRARAQLGGAPPAGALVFDCICRNLILGERFFAAVQGVSEELGRVPLAGFETYGEIALAVGEMSGFHNTTTVVLAVPA